MTLVVSISGVRGIVGDGLTPDVVARWAAAHGATRRSATGRAAVVLGRDARVSGPMLAAAAAAGLRAVGCEVVDVGLACTPTILLAVRREGAAGGIAVTASHNPAQWNALKLASERGLFLTPGEATAVRGLVEKGPIPYAGWDGLGGIETRDDATPRHVAAILDAPYVAVEAVRGRGFRIVLDACAGVGGLVLVPLLDALGVEVEGLHLEPTGRFPRDPEPVAAHLSELGERVRATSADLGLAVDPDGDRLALVDGDGEPVGEDLTLALAVDRVLAERARAGEEPEPVVTNLSTSQVVDRVAEGRGAEVVRTPVGEVHVATRMLELGAAIGGEGNGGVILPAVGPTRDAGVAAALVLSSLAATGRALADAAGRLPTYAIVKAKLPLADLEPEALLERAATAFDGASADRADGLRLAWPDRGEWIHLRRSGTEPVVRVIAEAPGPDRAQALVDRARELAAGG